jgi:putative phosphoribosyl transferase
MPAAANRIFDLPELRNHAQVFRDRVHAGAVLAGMLAEPRGTDALVLAIPAGGVPVAAEVAGQLGLALDLAVVSKITLPWNTEAGYGAVAFDGTVRLNHDLISALALPPQVTADGIAATKAKIQRRLRKLRGDRPPPDLGRRTALLVDDGLASGFTLLTAVEAVRRLCADKILVGVPTGHAGAIERIAAEVDAVYCPNIRQGLSFAVADAYQRWSDVDESAVVAIMERFGNSSDAKGPDS